MCVCVYASTWVCLCVYVGEERWLRRNGDCVASRLMFFRDDHRHVFSIQWNSSTKATHGAKPKWPLQRGGFYRGYIWQEKW